MAIEYLSGNRATCVKSDIFSDSLGKSGDGANDGVTLLGATETLKSSADLDTDFSSNTGWLSLIHI